MLARPMTADAVAEHVDRSPDVVAVATGGR
jgi:hypothetical protein